MPTFLLDLAGAINRLTRVTRIRSRTQTTTAYLSSPKRLRQTGTLRDRSRRSVAKNAACADLLKRVHLKRSVLIDCADAHVAEQASNSGTPLLYNRSCQANTLPEWLQKITSWRGSAGSAYNTSFRGA